MQSFNDHGSLNTLKGFEECAVLHFGTFAERGFLFPSSVCFSVKKTKDVLNFRN